MVAVIVLKGKERHGTLPSPCHEHRSAHPSPGRRNADDGERWRRRSVGTRAPLDGWAAEVGSLDTVGRWSFSAEAGQEIRVTAESAAFDTVLELRSPAGALLAENDDCSSSTTDSYLETTIPLAGRYEIFVGVSEYGGRASDLPRTADAARRLASTLVDAGVLPAANTIVLTDREATVAGLETAVAELGPRVGSEDTFVAVLLGSRGSRPAQRPGVG